MAACWRCCTDVTACETAAGPGPREHRGELAGRRRLRRRWPACWSAEPAGLARGRGGAPAHLRCRLSRAERNAAPGGGLQRHRRRRHHLELRLVAPSGRSASSPPAGRRPAGDDERSVFSSRRGAPRWPTPDHPSGRGLHPRLLGARAPMVTPEERRTARRRRIEKASRPSVPCRPASTSSRRRPSP